MRKFFGVACQVLSFLLITASLALPLSVVATHVSLDRGATAPELLSLIASFLMCVIVVYIGVRIPIKKNRLLFALLFGLGIYAGLGYLAVFGPMKDTPPVMNAFGVEFANDILCYIGAGVLFVAILLGAEGRYLVRRANAPRKRKTPVAPKIRPNVPVLPATAPFQQQNNAQPYVGLNVYPSPASYVVQTLPPPIQQIQTFPPAPQYSPVQVQMPPYQMPPPQIIQMPAMSSSQPQPQQMPMPAQSQPVQMPPPQQTVQMPQTQIPSPVQAASSEEETQVYTPVRNDSVKYARDKWGNLVAYEELTDRKNQ